MKRILYIAMAIVISIAAFAPLQASAQVNFNLILSSPPPVPIVETVPAARPGYLWAPGYWNWNGNKHVWTEGHWEQVRQGQRYERTEWRREGDKWRLREGGWKKAKKNKKHKKHDHDDEHHGDDRHDNRGGGFCPPGQAKKGNC